MENGGSADFVAKHSSGNDIKKDDFAEEFSSNLPNMAMPSAPSGCSLYASLQLPPASKRYEDNGRDVAHGSASPPKKLEHATPIETMHVTGLGTAESLERPPVVFTKNHDVGPGAFPVRSSRNTAPSRTFRSPMSLYNSTREFTNEEYKQEEGLLDSAESYSGAHHNSRMATGSGLYTVEAQRIPDGHEDGTVVVAEAQHLRMKWYQSPMYRWIFVGLALFACSLVGAVVAMVVLVVRSPSAGSSSSLTPPTLVPITGAPSTPDLVATPPAQVPIAGSLPTSMPTSVTPLGIACTFLSVPDLTTCRSTLEFDTHNRGDTTTGSTIPSEIGLLTHLTYLEFFDNSMTSTIPSEMGLLTKLTYLHFGMNELTATIPSEIGLLTELTGLWFFDNLLTSTIPSEIGLLTKMSILNFSGNSLNSTIPSEIGLLRQLMWLVLSSNLLTSTIPTEIGLLKELTLLDFSNNMLRGVMPSTLCLVSSLNDSNIAIDCGEITCASGCCVDDTGSLCG